MDPVSETRTLAVAWARAFGQEGASEPPTEWLNLHSQSVVYSDHAFRIRRRGHQAIVDHITTWKRAIPDFRMEITDIWPELSKEGMRRLTFQYNGSGTFLNDVARTIKASGKTFLFQGRVDLTLNTKDGLIDAIDEYYPFSFDSGNSIEDYRKRDEEWR